MSISPAKNGYNQSITTQDTIQTSVENVCLIGTTFWGQDHHAQFSLALYAVGESTQRQASWLLAMHIVYDFSGETIIFNSTRVSSIETQLRVHGSKNSLGTCFVSVTLQPTIIINNSLCWHAHPFALPTLAEVV